MYLITLILLTKQFTNNPICGELIKTSLIINNCWYLVIIIIIKGFWLFFRFELYKNSELSCMLLIIDTLTRNKRLEVKLMQYTLRHRVI